MTAQTIERLLLHHEKEHAKATVLTALAENPAGYGRIIRNGEGAVERIVEQKDATDEEKTINEVSTGTYCFDNEALFQALKQVGNDNAQGEYYLPDVMEILKANAMTIAAYQTDNFEETIGINDRVALAEAESVMKRRINEHWMREGVSIIDPLQTYISLEATIGQDTVIYPGTIISGATTIGKECVIGSNSEIKDSKIGDRTEIRQSVIHDSEIGCAVSIGPFAHIRPKSAIGDDVKLGNFVEVKKSSVGTASKISHLSYIGDAEIGSDVNVGCGAITVNYDGKNKYVTKVEDNAFIGCNSNLVAPVTVGKGAFVAAGSTITDDVPSDSLTIARARQVNKDGYLKQERE